jgi:hypothetical protein
VLRGVSYQYLNRSTLKVSEKHINTKQILPDQRASSEKTKPRKPVRNPILGHLKPTMFTRFVKTHRKKPTTGLGR